MGIEWTRISARAVTAALLVTLAACGQPTVDTSSDEAMETSISEMVASLPAEKEAQLRESLRIVAMSEMDLGSAFRAALRGEEVNTDQVASIARDKLHGMTADQILMEAERIRSERRQRQIAQAKSEIAELEEELDDLLAQKEKAESLQSELDKIEVKRTRLYWQEPSEYTVYRRLRLELTVTNNLDTAISRLYATGTLTTPGRSVPWLVEDFNYKVAGGLEPGETQNWTLSPNTMMSGWSSTPKERDDTVFTVTVRNVDGPLALKQGRP